MARVPNHLAFKIYYDRALEDSIIDNTTSINADEEVGQEAEDDGLDSS